MDYQPHFVSTISSTDGDALVRNATNLGKIAKTFNIPAILTTIGQTSFGGPIFSELQEIFPHQKAIERTTLSVFEDNGVLAVLEKIGRNKLLVAGLWTDFGVAASVRQARNLGYDVFIVVDACGDMSARAHRIAIERMLQEGAVPMTWLQLLLTLHREWAPPDTYEVLLHVAKEHAKTYGLDLQYTQTLPDEGQNRFVNDKPREGRCGIWSVAPMRSLKRFQKRL
jgi:nicotinamidase-related amidase